MSTITTDHRAKNTGKVSILAIGNELLKGDIADKNAAYLARELRSMGLELHSISMCIDDHDEIQNELQRLAKKSALIITSGGLGPTSDDITRDAVAACLKVGLVQDDASRQRLNRYYGKRNRPVTENAVRQVFFPEGARILENQFGTADSFLSFYETLSCWVLALPGVPGEVRGIFETQFKPIVSDIFPSFEVLLDRKVKLFGLSESFVGSEISKLKLPQGVEIAYRPSFPELMLVLSCSKGVPFENQADLLEQSVSIISQSIGVEYFYSLDGQPSLTEVVADLLKEKNLSISAAESCSGGLFAHQFVSLPGSSIYFKGSVVSYSNEAKAALLSVQVKTLETRGAVSKECADEMARGALAAFSSDYAVSITGIAGPDGGTDEKPVGRVYIAVASKNQDNKVDVFSDEYDLNTWSRNYVRTYSVIMAIELLRRTILKLPTTWERK